jgi:hypothetical protein
MRCPCLGVIIRIVQVFIMSPLIDLSMMLNRSAYSSFSIYVWGREDGIE